MGYNSVADIIRLYSFV